MFADPNPLPVHPDKVEIEPLWVCPVVTRGQAFDNQVAPGFRDEQMRDDEIREIRERLLVRPDKKEKRKQLVFRLIDDVVYVTHLRQRRCRRFYVPASLIPGVLEREHTVAHFGADKMFASLRKKYYWRDMMKTVIQFVRECYTCQVCKRNYRHATVPLRELPRPSKPQDIIAMDVKGPLPMSNGKRYIIVAVDMFTRHAVTRAVAHVDGKVVVDFLVEDVFRFGVPYMLITDNARNLRSGIAGYMYEKFGIENRNSIPFFASSNGGVERLIGTLASMLRCASADDPVGWSKLVQELTREYNHSVHRAINMTPFELHFGYLPRKLTDLPLQEEQGRNLAEPERYLRDRRMLQEKAKAAVQAGLGDYYGRMAMDYDGSRRARAHRFRVGNWVLVKIIGTRPGESKALGPLYHGPAEIMSVTPTSATVRFLSNGAERIRSVSHLKPYYGSKEGERLQLFTAPDGNIVDEAEQIGHDTNPVAGPSNSNTNTPSTPNTLNNTVNIRQNDSDDDDDNETTDARVRFEDD